MKRSGAAPSEPEAGSARQVIRGEACGFADLGRFNLWRPMVVARTGGSKCVQAQPAGRQRDQGSLRRLSYARIAWPPRQQAEPGTARPLTLSNAVPWFSSEEDTFLSIQFLVVNGRRGSSN